MRFIILAAIFSISLLAAQYYVDFIGNKTFSKERLYKELGLERSWWERLIHPKEKPKVEDKLLPVLLEELENFYRSQGFWEVEVDIKLDKDTAYFIIKENRPIIVKDISITSNFPIHLKLKKGDRFIVSKFKETKAKTKEELLKKGYCSYEFIAKAYVFEKKYEAYLTFYLDKGKICKIKNISVSGLKTVPKKVVISHIYLTPGSKFSLEKVKESYRRLYSLGYFQFLQMDYSTKIDNNIILKINARERRKKNIYKAGIGYDSQNGIHLNLYYKNLNFHLFQPSVELYYSNNHKKIDFNLFYPSVKIYRYYVDTVTNIMYESRDYDSFYQKSRLLSLKLLKEYFRLSGSLKFTLEKVSIEKSSSPCIKNRKYTLLYPSLFLLFDNRDSKLSPNRGYFIEDEIQLSIKSVSDSQFIKNRITGGIFYPFKEAILFAKASLGTITATKDLPPHMLFYAGGAKSNRAYTYQQIKALDSDCEIGGKTLLDTTVEGRYRYKEGVKLALFWDRTYLSRREFHISDYVDGVGIGAIIDTPLGEFKAYFGVNPNKISQNALNIFLGASF